MTTAHAAGMIRLHEKMARAFREHGQLKQAEAAERRAAECRDFLQEK